MLGKGKAYTQFKNRHKPSGNVKAEWKELLRNITEPSALTSKILLKLLSIYIEQNLLTSKIFMHFIII